MTCKKRSQKDRLHEHSGKVLTLSSLVIPEKINRLIYRRVTTVVSEKGSNGNMVISENPPRHQSNIKKSLYHCVQTAWWSYLLGTLVQLIV